MTADSSKSSSNRRRKENVVSSEPKIKKIKFIGNELYFLLLKESSSELFY